MPILLRRGFRLPGEVEKRLYVLMFRSCGEAQESLIFLISVFLFYFLNISVKNRPKCIGAVMQAPPPPTSMLGGCRVVCKGGCKNVCFFISARDPSITHNIEMGARGPEHNPRRPVLKMSVFFTRPGRETQFKKLQKHTKSTKWNLAKAQKDQPRRL